MQDVFSGIKNSQFPCYILLRGKAMITVVFTYFLFLYLFSIFEHKQIALLRNSYAIIGFFIVQIVGRKPVTTVCPFIISYQLKHRIRNGVIFLTTPQKKGKTYQKYEKHRTFHRRTLSYLP